MQSSESPLNQADTVLSNVARLFQDSGEYLTDEQKLAFSETHRRLKARRTELDTSDDPEGHSEYLDECQTLRTSVRGTIESAQRADLRERFKLKEQLEREQARAQLNNKTIHSDRNKNPSGCASKGSAGNKALPSVNQSVPRNTQGRRNFIYYENMINGVNLGNASSFEGLTIHNGGHHQTGRVITKTLMMHPRMG